MSEDFPYLPPLVPDDKTVCESVPSGSGEQLPIIAAKTGVTIGTDFDRRVPVTVADREREGGVYILGQPRTGKSTLLVSMALQDITNGHGLLFIDPHTDAIQDLLARIPQERLKDVIFLDPTDKTRSFGINLLHCTDPTNPLAIEDTWGRLRDIFVKLWEQETRQLGFWIDKILRNSVYLLVETDAYTIVEMPLLLDEDTTFRNRLLEKVAVKPFVKDFWYKDFDRLTRRDRTEQVDPALNRLGRFRDNEYLRSIVGQTQTDSTLDFQKIMADEKIVLLLLPENLTSDVKDAIGTIVLSELLYAANERAALRAEDRRYFGVYCDEFQQFATPDFARLFTQTGKFGVMPVVAHQTREQFKSRDDPNRGATAASRTKVFFTLSPHDAREMPLVFAKEPPTETKREEKYAISQTPVYHLLRRGHDDPLIRAFVDAHLRPLQYEIEDIWDDIKAEELLRRDFLDQAALDRIEERISWVDERGRTTPAILGRAAAATQQARLQTTRIESILETGRTLKQSVRDINRFLTTVMEGKSVSSQEDFSNFLIARTRASSAISNDDRTLLELYISLVYGDPQKPRGIPYAFACANPFLFSGETAALTLQLSSALDKARADCTERYLRQETQRWVNHDWYLRHRETFPYERHVPLSIQSKRFNDEEMRQKRASILESISGVRSALDVRSVYTCFVWLQCFPELEMLIAPYYTRRFKPRWSGNFNKRTVWFRERLERRFWKGYEEPDYVAFLSARVVSNLLSFLSRYGEGAYVALEMLVCATNGGPPINIYCGKADYYTPWCAGAFPAIDGCDALEVLCQVRILHDFMWEKREEFEKRCLGYFDFREHKRQQWRGQYREDDGKRMSGERLANYQLHAVEEAGFRVGRTGCVYERSFMNDIKKREDVVILTDLLRQHNEWFINQLSATVRSLWNALSEFTKAYLLARAGDAIFLGEEVANATFPELRGYEGIMDSLRGLYRHKEQIEEEKWIKEQKERIDGECERKVAEITVPVPVNVVDRVLTREERRQVRSVLENKFIENAPVTAMIKVVKEFAGFCERLSIPENHIKVPTGQYIEREVPSRQEADMVNEAARVLSSVDRYTGYVRLEKREGEAGAWRGKVRMEKLVAVPADALAAAQNAIEAYVRRYTRPREEIRREIEERRRLIRVQAACGRTEAERQAPPPPQKSGSGPEEEPPPPARRRLVRSSGEAREEEA